MDRAKICDVLYLVLADTYALMLKTQNYHWNVRGENFASIHAMTEVQYTELFAAVDEIAERIRALGGPVAGTFSGFSRTTGLSEADYQKTAMEMVKDLADSNRHLATELGKHLEEVDDEDDIGTEDLLTQRLRLHDKVAWMWQMYVTPDGAFSLPEAPKKKKK
ncbi:MAG: DNA starvation/stationary phase protection protein [Fimbriimonadaceae bacterium]|nr:DNA starvation/stationary phase protection protein [Fimbriimonadaceae bacterium]